MDSADDSARCYRENNLFERNVSRSLWLI